MQDKWLTSKILRVEQIFATLLTCLMAVLILPPMFLFYCVCVVRWALVRSWILWREKGVARVASGMDALWTSDLAGAYYPIITVLFFDGTPNLHKLRSLVLKQVTTVKELRKLRQHQSDEWGLFVWRYEKKFSIDDHVFLEKEVQGDLQLQSSLCQLSIRPFVHDRSPWRLHVIPIKDDRVVNRFCAVFCVDHSMADGLSLVHVFMKHVMDVPPQPPSAPSAPKTATAKNKLPLKRVLETLIRAPSTYFCYFARKDRHSLHGRSLSRSKIVRWSKPIDVDHFKRIRRVMGATFNDVYLSCLTGALRRHFLSKSSQLPLTVTSIIPIALPPKNPENIPLENNITVALLRLPIHVQDSLSRVSTMSKLMKEGKSSPDVIINAWTFRNLVNCMPLGVSRRIFRKTPATLVSSTVAGPPEPLKVWGWPLERVLYYIPHRGATGVTSCLISYAGKATLTLYVDEKLVSGASEVDKMIEYFTEEVDYLIKCASKVKPQSC